MTLKIDNAECRIDKKKVFTDRVYLSLFAD